MCVKVCEWKNNFNNNICEHNNPLMARVYQPTAGIMSTCPQREVNDHRASLGLTRGKNIKSPRDDLYNYCI